MKRPLITYFDVRGRAEVIRLILEEKEIAYREKRVAIEEWPAFKPTLLFGQLPTFEYESEQGKIVLNQSHAIYRHLARTLDLYGQTEAEHVRCDIVEEAFVDAQNNLGGFYWNPQFAEKRTDYEKNDLPALLNKLQQLLQQNQQGQGFWVGTGLTYVDFCAWHFLDYVRPFSQRTLEQFELLYQFKQRLEMRPRIAAYLASPRRPATLTVSMAPFGGTPETS